MIALQKQKLMNINTWKKTNSLKLILFYILFSNYICYSQSDFDKILKSGEIIVNGLSFLKKDKSETKETNSKVIESVCIKNKLTDKITFIISGKDAEDNTIKKEMVIQKEGKECVFELPKGIYAYEIILSNKEIGTYPFNGILFLIYYICFFDFSIYLMELNLTT